MEPPKPLPKPPGRGFPTKPLPKPPGKPLPRPPGLLEAMQRCHDQGIPLGVLLIDESEGAHDQAPAQLQVLQQARRLGQKVIIININPELQHDPRSLIIDTRREFLPYAHQVVNKPFLNAFDEGSNPSLERTLNLCGLPFGSKLVVMGYAVNQCVRLTAVGGSDKKVGPFKRGATQRGYTVMSCSQVLRGGEATWKTQPGVEFFDHV